MQRPIATPTPQERQAGIELSQALLKLWFRFKQTNLARVTTIGDVVAGLRAGTCDDAQRQAAQRDAHKLAGVAGSFGFGEASRLARDAEHLLQAQDLPADQQAAELDTIVVGLRRELHRDIQPSTPELARQSGGPYVLIVDDDLELGQRLTLEAEAQQLRARHVVSVEAARAAIAECLPDVVLLDLTFDQDSEASLVLLSELAEREPGLPVLVFTARASLVDRVAVAERGAVVYLQKPVPPAYVMEAVSQVLKRDRTVEARVLVVDDDPLVLEAVETLLSSRGYRVTTLADPLKFWDVLEESPPDLLLLDIDMPGLTGIDLCRAVRTDLRWAGVPILFLTARDDRASIEQLFSVGADDYIAKPMVGAELLTRLDNRLQRTQLHRRLAETDVLTGLANRQKATQLVSQLLRLSQRHGKPVSLAVIDLDHFKDINDRFGHSVGDAVLRRAADLLTRAFRRDDVVGRWGGEEFLVGLYGMPRASGQERLRHALESLQAEEFDAPDGQRFHVSFSAGVAEYPADGQDMPSLFRAADATLYQAKAAGRGQVLSAA